MQILEVNFTHIKMRRLSQLSLFIPKALKFIHDLNIAHRASIQFY